METYLNLEFATDRQASENGHNNSIGDNCSNDSQPFFTAQELEYDSNDELIVISAECSPIMPKPFRIQLGSQSQKPKQVQGSEDSDDIESGVDDSDKEEESYNKEE